MNELDPTQEQQEKQYTIYCDLDGVLADFSAAVTKIMHEMGHPEFKYSTENWTQNRKVRDLCWATLAKYQEKFGPVIWRHLDLMPDAYELWNYIKPYKAQILSATGQPRFKSVEQKRGWFTEHFGSNVHMNFVQTAADKSKYAQPDRILIDDQKRAVDPWVAAGGVGIIHTNAANTIRQLKDLGL